MSDGIGNILSPLVAFNPRPVEGPSGPGAGSSAARPQPRSEPPSSEERTAAAPRQDTRAAAEAIDRAELDQVVESINSYLQSTQRALEFSVDEASGRTVITVMDGDREQVIRQIPPEAVLALAEQIQEEQDVRGTGLVDKA